MTVRCSASQCVAVCHSVLPCEAGDTTHQTHHLHRKLGGEGERNGGGGGADFPGTTVSARRSGEGTRGRGGGRGGVCGEGGGGVGDEEEGKRTLLSGSSIWQQYRGPELRDRAYVYTHAYMHT